MKIALLQPLNLSRVDKNFVLNFSLLEHDIIYFFSKRQRENALKHINMFLDRQCFKNINSDILTNSLIGLASGITAASYTSNLNINNFLELRLLFINYLEANPCTADTFRDLLLDIFTTYFAYIDNIDESVNFDQLSKQVALTIYYINAHCHEKIDARSVARKLNLNYDYTLKLFQKELGFSINFYIRRSKLAEAQKLLIQSGLSIQQISDELNFYDVASFSKHFKNKFLMSLSKFRRLNKLIYN